MKIALGGGVASASDGSGGGGGGDRSFTAGTGVADGWMVGCVTDTSGAESEIFGGSEGRGSLRMRMGGFSKESIARVEGGGATVSIWLKVRFGPEVWTFSPTRRNRRKIILLVLP